MQQCLLHIPSHKGISLSAAVPPILLVPAFWMSMTSMWVIFRAGIHLTMLKKHSLHFKKYPHGNAAWVDACGGYQEQTDSKAPLTQSILDSISMQQSVGWWMNI